MRPFKVVLIVLLVVTLLYASIVLYINYSHTSTTFLGSLSTPCLNERYKIELYMGNEFMEPFQPLYYSVKFDDRVFVSQTYFSSTDDFDLDDTKPFTVSCDDSMMYIIYSGDTSARLYLHTDVRLLGKLQIPCVSTDYDIVLLKRNKVYEDKQVITYSVEKVGKTIQLTNIFGTDYDKTITIDDFTVTCNDGLDAVEFGTEFDKQYIPLNIFKNSH